MQGAEARVLAGAHQTLERFRPALFLELDDRQLRRYGSSACDLLATAARKGYTIHTQNSEGLSPPLSPDRAQAVETKGYQDILLLPEALPHSVSQTIDA